MCAIDVVLINRYIVFDYEDIDPVFIPQSRFTHIEHGTEADEVRLTNHLQDVFISYDVFTLIL